MVKSSFCGLDFGTSNSTIGILKNAQPSMVSLEAGKPTIRSAIFFDYESGGCRFGQQGITDYLSGISGRLMMSLKSILGSSLMQEDTLIQDKRVPYTEILGCLIRYIKQKAEAELGRELTEVVLGRPVHFHDDDLKRDWAAQDTLEGIVLAQGFKTVQFQYEPIAAALTYEQSITHEQLALIIDLGGGTSDFTVIRLRPNSQTKDRREDVLANEGIHIGGTDFDTRYNLKVVMPHLGLGGDMRGLNGKLPIPSSYFYDLTTWHTLHNLYTPKAIRELCDIRNRAFIAEPLEKLIKVIENQQGHKILYEIEQSKCLLSKEEKGILDFSFIEKEFLISVERSIFQALISDKVDQLVNTLLATVNLAGVKMEAIDSLFFTGGSTQIPIIRQKIIECFPNANIVQGDVYSSVGKGLILDAQARFT